MAPHSEQQDFDVRTTAQFPELEPDQALALLYTVMGCTKDLLMEMCADAGVLPGVERDA